MLPLLWLLWAPLAAPVPVDNGQAGKIEIECGPETVRVNFNTRNNFEGHVYVKGRFAEPDCRNSETGRMWAGLELPFNRCGLRRLRSLDPRGVFITFNLIITFHPFFVTKVDRAYQIQCFYMEADKTVDTGVEVSMLTTGLRTDLVPMPVCRYEVLDGGPSGPLVEFAAIGQKVYHKWTCDTESVDTFCAVIHSCFVDDTTGDRVELVDEAGCALDRNLLDNLEYQSDLMAGRETHVFKFADRADLYFNCQVAISVKEPGEGCERPVCPDAPASLGRRRRRQVAQTSTLQPSSLDLASQDLHVLDLPFYQTNSSLPAPLPRPQRPEGWEGPVCFDRTALGVSFSATVLLSSALSFLLAFACLKATAA